MTILLNFFDGLKRRIPVANLHELVLHSGGSERATRDLYEGDRKPILFLSLAAAGVLSAHGPFWPLPSEFLTGTAAVGISLINSLANLSGFVGPRAIGLLNHLSGNFQSGLLVLAAVPLVGMALPIGLRAGVLRTAPKAVVGWVSHQNGNDA